ncbi:MAG TPA: transcription termination/antitermination NusG family protein [Pyrinomonadaceae bacterium]|nr:transcription termination/antitermination NusG family protein [Pyrinomonadaceae bacterium]
MSSEIGDSLCWYVVHTHLKQEERTSSNLRTMQLETLAPRLQVEKYNQYTGQLTWVVKPLFPNYIFARFKFNEVYHRIRFTRGVHSLVTFNNTPAPVDDEIIELIRSRMGDDGVVKTIEDLKPGDAVVIRDGRFKNLCGVFERGMPDADRVRVLLNTVSFQAHVVVNRALVSKISPDERSGGVYVQ